MLKNSSYCTFWSAAFIRLLLMFIAFNGHKCDFWHFTKLHTHPGGSVCSLLELSNATSWPPLVHPPVCDMIEKEEIKVAFGE